MSSTFSREGKKTECSFPMNSRFAVRGTSRDCASATGLQEAWERTLRERYRRVVPIVYTDGSLGGKDTAIEKSKSSPIPPVTFTPVFLEKEEEQNGQPQQNLHEDVAATTSSVQVCTSHAIVIEFAPAGLCSCDEDQWRSLMIQLNPAWGQYAGQNKKRNISVATTIAAEEEKGKSTSLSPLLNFARARRLATRHGVIIATARVQPIFVSSSLSSSSCAPHKGDMCTFIESEIVLPVREHLLRKRMIALARASETSGKGGKSNDNNAGDSQQKKSLIRLLPPDTNLQQQQQQQTHRQQTDDEIFLRNDLVRETKYERIGSLNHDVDERVVDSSESRRNNNCCGMLIGTAQLDIHYKQCETLGRIDDVVVDDSFRRMGIANALINCLVAVGKDRMLAEEREEEEEEKEKDEEGESSKRQEQNSAPLLLSVNERRGLQEGISENEEAEPSPYHLRYVTLSSKKPNAVRLYKKMGFFVPPTQFMSLFTPLTREDRVGAEILGDSMRPKL